MLEAFKSWSLGNEGGTPIVFVQVQPPTGWVWMDVLVPLLSALLGGALAILASHLTTNREFKSQRQKAIEERAALAVSGYLKLVAWTNLIEDIDGHVASAIKAATEEGIVSEDVSLLVGPSVGKLFEPEQLRADEFSFLLTSEHTSIVNKIQLLVQRAGNLHALLERYSVDRLEFGAWLIETSGAETKISGPTVESGFSREHQAKYDEKVSHLNVIIGNVIAMAERDKPLAYETCKQFSTAAKAFYGDAFPLVNIAKMNNADAAME